MFFYIIHMYNSLLDSIIQMYNNIFAKKSFYSIDKSDFSEYYVSIQKKALWDTTFSPPFQREPHMLRAAYRGDSCYHPYYARAGNGTPRPRVTAAEVKFLSGTVFIKSTSLHLFAMGFYFLSKGREI